MRLKTYSAPSVRAAMDMIRLDLGPDAIIVSTQRAPKGVRVTAATGERPQAPAPATASLPRIRQVLAAHGLPEPLRLRILEAAETAIAVEPAAETEQVLAAALAGVLRFAPLPAGKAERPLLLVGPPGAGKTSLAGKLAARAWADQRSVRVITTDPTAGGVEQLRAYTGALTIGLRSAADRVELKAALAGSASADLVLIDTTGVNPFDAEDMRALANLRAAVNAEPLLVLASGVDSEDGGEIAAAFAAFGCRRLCATRLDIARRLGGVLALADSAPLALAGLSQTPRIAHGVIDADAAALARRLLTISPRAATAPDKAAPHPQKVHA